MQRPNILVILADDLAAWMLGCYGNQEIKTPNIDNLARAGVRFANSFCPRQSARRAGQLFSPGDCLASTASRTSWSNVRSKPRPKASKRPRRPFRAK